jgi:hypothetical protein
MSLLESCDQSASVSMLMRYFAATAFTEHAAFSPLRWARSVSRSDFHASPPWPGRRHARQVRGGKGIVLIVVMLFAHLGGIVAHVGRDVGGPDHSLISRSASAGFADACMRLSTRSPTPFPESSLTGTTVPSAGCRPASVPARHGHWWGGDVPDLLDGPGPDRQRR